MARILMFSVLAVCLFVVLAGVRAEEQAVDAATVVIDGFQFQPEHVVLKQGGKVTFINRDTTPHTATPNPGSKFTGTGRIEHNAARTVVFETPGEQTYFCEIHPSMQGRISVQPR